MSTQTARLSAALAGRYRIERELGQGGMATVYLAEDVKHKRKVGTADGSRFVIVRYTYVQSPPGDVHLMVNWFPELRRLFDRVGPSQ